MSTERADDAGTDQNPDNTGRVHNIAEDIRIRGAFLRRRDLLALGHTDGGIRASLRHRRIFRVRQGWYSIPGTPDPAVRAVRVGGRLTGVAALESYGLRVPRRERVDIAVPSWARKLRNPVERRERLSAGDGIRTHWIDSPVDRRSTKTRWRTSVDDALLVILRTEDRDIAVACCSAVMHHFRWNESRMDAVFRRAPKRTWAWRSLVSGLDESHGETFTRLWFGDVGINYESQPFVAGVGFLDGQVSPNVYIEIDGAQHDASWTGEGVSTFHKDHVRDTEMARRGKWVLRFDYAQLYGDWAGCLAATRRAIADDLALIAYRRRHPYRERHPAVRPPVMRSPALQYTVMRHPAVPRSVVPRSMASSDRARGGGRRTNGRAPSPNENDGDPSP